MAVERCRNRIQTGAKVEPKRLLGTPRICGMAAVPGPRRGGVAMGWRAHELDPFGVTGTTMGWMLFQSRHFDEAVRELRSDLAVHPNDASSYWFLGFALIANNQAGE